MMKILLISLYLRKGLSWICIRRLDIRITEGRGGGFIFVVFWLSFRSSSIITWIVVLRI